DHPPGGAGQAKEKCIELISCGLYRPVCSFRSPARRRRASKRKVHRTNQLRALSTSLFFSITRPATPDKKKKSGSN
ncbi:hypothetical protein, partial [Brucella sp. NVSL 07-0026]|uniref:hypothetical protein n=1 Tax=Brucella sp. NVSL 07-0026 TaxID=520448 RepID=UPI001AEBD370